MRMNKNNWNVHHPFKNKNVKMSNSGCMIPVLTTIGLFIIILLLIFK